MFYKDVFEALNAREVRYLVVGGVAMNLHGVPRMTYDLDLMISLDTKNITLTWDALHVIGFRPRVPMTLLEFSDEEKRDELKESKNMLVLSFFRGEKKFEVVDIFVHNPLDFERCYSAKHTIDLDSIPVHVVGITQLIDMKKAGGREQDIVDIHSLERLGKND